MFDSIPNVAQMVNPFPEDPTMPPYDSTLLSSSWGQHPSLNLQLPLFFNSLHVKLYSSPTRSIAVDLTLESIYSTQ